MLDKFIKPAVFCFFILLHAVWY